MHSATDNLSISAVAAGFIVGLAYWIWFFAEGGPTFTSHDWLKEQVFSNLLRDSLLSFRLPWRISNDFYHAGVYELIVNPEVSLTPDFLLLAWLPNSTYFRLHWFLFYSLGFLGTVMIARRFAISSLPFLFFVALFNFNGYIGSHISEGHIQWAGYFLFPLFFSWWTDMAASCKVTRTISALKIALLLGLLFINGSFHNAIWCSMLMTLSLTYRKDLWRPVVLALLLAGLIWICRIVPAAFYFPPKTQVYPGYVNINTLLNALTFICPPANQNECGSLAGLGWHELSLYCGFLGFVFLVVGPYVYAKSKLRVIPNWWIPAAIVMALLSMGYVYQLIPKSGLPFSTIERVPSRFMVMPFCVLLIIAAAGFTHLEKRYRYFTRLALSGFLLPMLVELLQNARKWRIQSYESVTGPNQIPIVTIVDSHDQFLRAIVGASWTVSFVAAAVTIVWVIRLRRTAT